VLLHHALQVLGQLPALTATSPVAAAPVQLRVRGHSHSIAAMADGQAGGGARRIVLFFRNDLRVRDNVIVHQAVQKVKAGEYDEVRCKLHEQQQQQLVKQQLQALPSAYGRFLGECSNSSMRHQVITPAMRRCKLCSCCESIA
jgi:hypothetical protein